MNDEKKIDAAEIDQDFVRRFNSMSHDEAKQVHKTAREIREVRDLEIDRDDLTDYPIVQTKDGDYVATFLHDSDAELFIAACRAQLSSGVPVADKRDEVEQLKDEIETLKGQLNDFDIDLRSANLKVGRLSQCVGEAIAALRSWDDWMNHLNELDAVNGDGGLAQLRFAEHGDRIALTQSALAALAEAKEGT